VRRDGVISRRLLVVSGWRLESGNLKLEIDSLG